MHALYLLQNTMLGQYDQYNIYIYIHIKSNIPKAIGTWLITSDLVFDWEPWISIFKNVNECNITIANIMYCFKIIFYQMSIVPSW